MTPIQEWYTNRTVLVTGGTGFMGKILVEKLLRSLPGLTNLYVIVRPKRGLSPSERISQIIELPIFEKIRDSCPEVLKKLHAIEGDVGQENLGISTKDRQMLINEVSVVFHAAATLRLDAELKDAVIQNTLGTKRVLEMCQQMKKLEAVVHLSTAFCHCDVDLLEEKMYPPLKDPYEIVNLVSTLCEKKLKAVQKELLLPHPNSYTFSKRLAETVAWDMGKKLPLAITRPSIVIPALYEPLPGWVDSLNGPVGLLVGAGKGVIRTMLVEAGNHADIIPVDVAANGLITCAWYRATRRFEETPIYNMTQPQDILCITWGEVLDKAKAAFFENPFDWILWYPGGSMRTNRFTHYICLFLFHIIPAYFIDFLLLIFLQKRFMVRVQRRITTGLELLQYFTMREWHFANDKALAVSKHMSDRDLEIFYLANANFDVEMYLLTAILGTRKYCLKEDLRSLPRARRYLTFLYYLDVVTKAFLVFLVVWGVLSFL